MFRAEAQLPIFTGILDGSGRDVGLPQVAEKPVVELSSLGDKTVKLGLKSGLLD